jgi:predicted nucleotidyltransferase
MTEREMAEQNKILVIRTGSHLYGTNVPESDEDFMGLFVAPKEYYLGMKTIKEVNCNVVSKTADGKNDKDAIDSKLYELKNFVRLAADGNPNIIESLFVNENNITYANFIGRRLLHEKFLFPSKLVKQRFIGYAISQLHKAKVKPDNFEQLTEFKKQYNDGYVSNRRLIELKYLSHPICKLVVFYNEHATIGGLNFNVNVKMPKVYDSICTRLEKASHRQDMWLKYGVDCYSIDTEFLTETGWKFYDEISNEDKLASIDSSSNIIFQHYIDRVKKEYSGIMYEIKHEYSNCMVTPNHRMYTSKIKNRNIYKVGYIKENAQWEFAPLQSLIDSRQSRYHILHNINNSNLEYPIDDTLLILLGFYISEGNLSNMNPTTHKYNSLNITQTNHSKSEFFSWMDQIVNIYNFITHVYNRNNKLIETRWITFNKKIVSFIQENCGALDNKHLPSFISNLSTRQCKLLLHYLFLGDGTITRTKNEQGICYYSSNYNIASGVQTLCLLAGFDSSLRGPYNYNEEHKDAYQVYYKPDKIQIPCAICLPKDENTQRSSYTKYNYNGNICCFSVSNEILITRRKGKIAIQGNTKFMQHCVRLMIEGKELLETGKIEFPLKERQLLLDIRQGKLSLEEIHELVEDKKNELENFESSLPATPDFDKINDLLIKLIELFWENETSIHV